MVVPTGPPPIEQMEHFFNSVLSLGGEIWANEPATTYRSALMGEIALKMTSSEPIMWEWIRGYLIGAASQIIRLSPHISSIPCSSAYRYGGQELDGSRVIAPRIATKSVGSGSSSS